jgi:hypothetical protein
MYPVYLKEGLHSADAKETLGNAKLDSILIVLDSKSILIIW